MQVGSQSDAVVPGAAFRLSSLMSQTHKSSVINKEIKPPILSLLLCFSTVAFANICMNFCNLTWKEDKKGGQKDEEEYESNSVI